MAEPLKMDMGRWASVDLYLEYAYEAINEPKYKDNCCSLWFEYKRIKSAVEWLKKQFERNQSGTDNPFSNTFIGKKIDQAFLDSNQSKRGKGK
jgi:hypothetical protein